jgi:integrase
MGRPRTELGTAGNKSVSGEIRDDAGRWLRAPEGVKPERYRARVRVRDDDGRTRQVVRFASTKGTAERALKAALKNRKTPTVGQHIRADMSVEDATALWLVQVNRPERDLSPRSIAQYDAAVRNHLLGSPIANLTLREVNRVSVVRSFLQGIADSTGTGAAKTARTALAGTLDLAVADDVLPFNAVRQVTPPRSRKTRETERDTARALTREEREHLVNVADEHPAARRQDVADIVAWMAATGVRIGEALGQRWEDLDLDAGTAVVRGTKTASAVRKLHLPSWIVERMRERVASRGGMVFPSPGDPRKDRQPDPNMPRDRRNVQRIMRDVFDAAGFPWATPHTLRRTAATLLDGAGESIADVAKHLGHRDPSMTMRVYLDRKGSATGAAAVL